jgi:hypothetical protein
VLAHNGLDGLGSLVGMVEWDSADVVVEDVGLDDAVEKLAANEAELSIDCSGSAAGVCPGGWGVVRECGIGVLEEGDRNYTY